MPLPSFRMGEAYNAIDSSLVLDLDAANYSGTGTAWNDATRNSNNSVLINGVGYTASNNGAMVFDGVNDQVDCGPATYLNSGLTGLTVSVWVYSTNRGAACILENGNAYATNTFYLFQENTNNYSFLVSGSAYSGILTNSIYNVNTWTHLVGTWESLKYPNIYVNGVLDNGSSLGTSVIETYLHTGNTNLFMGIRPVVNTYPFNGKISQVKIYNRSLSAYEVSQQFQATRARYGI